MDKIKVYVVDTYETSGCKLIVDNGELLGFFDGCEDEETYMVKIEYWDKHKYETLPEWVGF